ncbi:MAG: ABC transporter permease subunit [Anaerolineae bacterium]|nr:ABC transporter permease subunit [Anaerolineae bacterium]NIN93777.1 ABC transporter permease subunit [Anaerolineae bacterium]NIQ76812.1 ABC transporter permease subunit [Anaerolineae bacterium]
MAHARRERWFAFLMLLPSIILIAIFVYGFIGWTTTVSLSKWDGIEPDYTWVGLENFRKLLIGGGTSARRFHIDLWNTLFFTLLFLVACVVVGLVLAILLDQNIKGEGIFRTIYLFPMAISFVVTGVVWQWVFAPGTDTRLRGVNALLHSVGLDSFRWGWYTDTTSIGPFHVALIPVIIAAAWQLTGYTMAMYLAGLRSIPEELREAARVDGASEIGIYRHVILPMLQPITLSALIILGHTSLKIFDLVFTMTGRGPGFVTDVPGIFMFETTFQGNHYSQGAAISIIMLLTVAVVIVPYLIYSLRREVEL